MARERAQEKIGSGNEEFKRFEEEVVERHREQVLRELDRRASGELLESGRYINKGYVRRNVETSVWRVWIRVKLLK